MIATEAHHEAPDTATLDDLFRRAGVRHPDALALADPPNRDAFSDGAPRKLNFAQADRAISACAAKLRGLGLQTGSVVAMHLPNTVESVVTFLGVLRAGMLAAPLPLLWRKSEITSALARVGAKAIVTCSRTGPFRHAEIAMESAAELFSVRHVCGFGQELPDGLVPLEDIFTCDPVSAATPRIGHDAPAVVTFNPETNGLVAMVRSHGELVAGGLEIFLKAGVAAETPILSTIPITSFAGIALTLLPWLFCGGALHLHHGFGPDAFAAQCNEVPNGILVLPAAAVFPIAKTGFVGANQTVVALWRAPERFQAAKIWSGPSVLLDVASFGEIGFVAARRGDNGLPVPIPLGVAGSSSRPPGAPSLVETVRTSIGTLALRGRMVPAQAHKETDQPLRFGPDEAGYLDTGFACHYGQAGRTLIVTGSPPDLIDVGGYVLRQSQIEALIWKADPKATILALPDGELGHRLAGTTADRAALQARLRAQGINPLVAEAFQLRGLPDAA